MKMSSGVVLVVMLVSGAWADGPEPALLNTGFELAKPGELPDAWEMRPLSRSQGYEARIAGEKPYAGRGCLELKQPALAGWGHRGLVTQRVPADVIRGKRIRFRAAVRAEVDGVGRGCGGLWARAVRPGGRPCPFADMGDRPVRSTEWAIHDVVLDVSDDAEELEVGFILNATGRCWFDSTSLDVIGAAGIGNEAPRRLEGRGLENLVALTRLLGYVRYFHPSDQAAAADWERFAIDAVGVVEPAQSPRELADRLIGIFAPLAPAVQIFPTAAPRAAIEMDVADETKVRRVAWRHLGVGCNASMAVYRSERVTDRNLPEGPSMPVSPEPLAKPGSSFEADLGGGVSCRLPLALFADARGTLPRAVAQVHKSPKPENFPPTGDDRATRLADVALIWNVLQHFYPYFDCVDTDWPAVLEAALTSAAVDGDAAAFHDTLRRLVAQVGDSHGFVRGGSGTFAIDGKLPLAWDWVEGRLVVTEVDAHARRGTIAPGDVVISIDGRAAGECVRDAEKLVCAATEQFRRFRAIQDLRNGPAGQSVTLELEPPGKPKYSAVLDRVTADDSPLRGPSLLEKRLAMVTEVEPGILYLDLSRLSDPELQALLPRLQKAKGIILDIRGYPSPSLDVDIVSRLSDRPLKSDRWIVPITRFPDRRQVTGTAVDWSLPPRKPTFSARATFITDARAVSAAETMLSLVSNHKLAPIVGGPTAGSNGSVNVYVLPGGYRVSWTGMKTLRQDGTRFHGVGVLPTVPAGRTIKGLAAGRDEVLEAALNLVRG